MTKTLEVFDPRVVDEPVEYDLDRHIRALLQSEPFFARVSRYVTKYASYGIPTAGVRINKHSLNFELIYNPKFFASLSDSEKLGVLMHEFYHITLAHCTSRNIKDENPFIQNIAMDLAINGLPGMPEKLPEVAIIPGKKQFKDLPVGQTFEWYLKELKKNVQEVASSGAGTLDDHSGWDSEDEVDGVGKAIAEAKIKDVILKAANECDIAGGHEWGTVSSDMRKIIRNIFSHKLDPKVIFRYFCKTSLKSNRKHRITKINKRWPYIHPGRTFERRANIAIAVDQSGSVGDHMLEQIFSWMNELAESVDFTVVPFDSEVFGDKVFRWKRGEKKPRERVLCGGTCFDAPTRWANENSVDGLVIFTDLCAPKPIKCQVPRLWITDRKCGAQPYFDPRPERVLIID